MADSPVDFFTKLPAIGFLEVSRVLRPECLDVAEHPPSCRPVRLENVQIRQVFDAVSEQIKILVEVSA
ncbi:hypothetical protein D3C81_2320720 [compost metagenome]